MQRYKFVDGSLVPHFITWTLTEWLPIFVADEYCRIIIDSLDHCRREKGLLVHGYVIMPTHAHGIVAAKRDDALVGILRDARRHTAKEIVRLLKERDRKLFEWVFRDAARKDGRSEGEHKVWTDGMHPEVLESAEFATQKFEYIHNNRFARGWLRSPSIGGIQARGSMSMERLDRWR